MENTENIQLNTKEEVVARAQELAQAEFIPEKGDVELLKQLFYRYHNQALQQARQEYLEQGGDPAAYVPVMDPQEETFRQAMQTIRERRAAEQLRIQEERADNLQRKTAILEQIQQLATTPEEAGAHFEQFKQLQQNWKEIGPVPAEQSTEIWKNYQLYTEQFYDLLKLGHEMRDYDFRKNLEIKTDLCEKAEALLNVEDVISAFGQLQALHQQWKETGPVERDLREDLWTRFKNASTEINKRHQAHFEGIKAREAENLAQKTALCEQAEALIQQTEAEGKKIEWDTLTKQILELQAQWRTIGFAPQKQNGTVFERFRQTCDQFFTRKAEFYKNIKDGQAENLEKKKALIAKAQELSTSTDWRATTDALVALQKEWKATGPVSRKFSDQLWKEFTTACDAFFEAKKQANSGERDVQKKNLQQKQEITAQLQALLDAEGDINLDQVKELQAQWTAVGHVPFKEKDLAYTQFRQVCDQLYDRARGARIQARTAGRFQKIQESAGGDRQRLQRIYEQLQAEIRTYENNIGFLTASSKKGNSLVDQMQKKVDALKAELAIMAQKIKETK
ncbi:MAG: DUF349 domain-containing protein [Bacteroidaceae bacterium]|nr:DUF349 domain-containing protein [Bacteroidaceae bacterium]